MDYTLEDTIYLMFTTRIFASGVPGTLAGTPVVSAYENDGTTEITAGITLGVDHDSRTGLNLLTIVATAANGYEAGKDYNLVITAGTVSSVSVVGEVIGTFSLGRSAAAVDLANGTDGLGAIKAVVDGIPTTAMRGTDSAATASALATAQTAIDAIPITPMRGTDNAALASVATEARLAELDPANLPTDVAAIPTTAMRGTDNAALASVATEARLAELDAANLPADVDSVLTDTGTTIPATISTAQADLDIITGADGVNLLAATQASIDAIEADSSELQTNQGNWITATGFSTHSAANVRTEMDSNSTQLAAIVADTGELQTNQGNWITATGFATAANLSTLDGKVVTVDTVVDGIAVQTARVDALIEDSAGDRFTAKALETGPTGSGGDATEDKQDSIIALIGTPAADLAADIAAINVGGGTGANPITVTLTDGTNPIQNGTVSVYLNGVLKGSGLTDASGNASLSLAIATYTVAAVADSHSFTPTTRTVTGSQAGTLTDDLEMALKVISAPSDPDFATVTGTLINASGEPVSSEEITFAIVTTGGGPVKAGGKILAKTYKAKTDAAGVFQRELARTDSMTPTGSTYEMTLADFDFDAFSFTIEAATLDLGTKIV